MEKQTEEDLGLVDFNPQKDQILDLWYKDSIEFGHGLALTIKIKNVLYHERSKYQEITILETEKLGRMLVIDGITMLTEYDEFAYHEMIAHVPLLVHPNPSKVLVIGGGDGGAVREILKHPEVKEVHLCEIDKEVVRASKKYFPSLASSLDDPRVTIFYEDGARFVADNPSSYDALIVDSTDPLGPGQILFQREFYENMKKALRDEGIAVTQCESIYLHQQVIKGVFSFAQSIFPKLGYYYTMVPTYPSGLIGFFFCSLKNDPIKDLDEARAANLKGLKYYSPQIHRSSFTLPRFASEFFR
ncbi:MAG: polyamine aminopropyltransferase [Deltaproteobacteria bacterium]|nr:polyamine aminopropyltransferase [Deltaproteobacteria bacterium]MBW1919394.1 polyamine aminopropyltransferase [Deltaproteobacteria bacterium]RLB34193.1 MAG: polyamine aminopropyltransferase [Deltaproteobacteria bacterium]